MLLSRALSVPCADFHGPPYLQAPHVPHPASLSPPSQAPALVQRAGCLHAKGGGWWRGRSTSGAHCFLDQHSALPSASSFPFTVGGALGLSGFCSAVPSPGSRACRRLCSSEPVIQCPSAFPPQGSVLAVTSFPVLFVLKDPFLSKSPVLSFLVGLKELAEVPCAQPPSVNRKHSCPSPRPPSHLQRRWLPP